MTRAALLFFVIAAFGQGPPPRFDGFPVLSDWNGPAAAPKLVTRSQRMFRTRLLNAASEPPNLAGHYRFEVWGCGSECMSGAILDLATGTVIPPPFAKGSRGWDGVIVCASAFEGSGIEVRVDSRLVIVRRGLNYDVQLDRNVPDVYYFVLEGHGFRELAHFHGKAARLLSQ
ncbi:MAG: hypothetical protein ABSE57_06490 [Bryobacteraceae bacterium]|jgi:hypothetical protein